MGPIVRVVETGIYADDLARAEAFYAGVLGLEVIASDPARHVFFRAGDGVLLVFRAEATREGGDLPPHGAVGQGHFALGIEAEGLDGWRRHLADRGVTVEQEVAWPRGARSLYFRDPAGNLVELITPGLWGLPGGW